MQQDVFHILDAGLYNFRPQCKWQMRRFWSIKGKMILTASVRKENQASACLTKSTHFCIQYFLNILEATSYTNYNNSLFKFFSAFLFKEVSKDNTDTNGMKFHDIKLHNISCQSTCGVLVEALNRKGREY